MQKAKNRSTYIKILSGVWILWGFRGFCCWGSFFIVVIVVVAVVFVGVGWWGRG